ncbi:recombinase RmuC [Paenibacillus sp. D9]|uniref:DNA recombination protein RmuC n=1 Tax=Paenibacillus TaxID=44249 RepID=UPI00061E4E51|nr:MULTISPECIES: DNA recombination protein RmuC [Paenibacillus]KKC47660.1 recombinase RmuC [Paenibacillus sp. D9]
MNYAILGLQAVILAAVALLYLTRPRSRSGTDPSLLRELDRIRDDVRSYTAEHAAQGRQEAAAAARQNREELAASMNAMNRTLMGNMNDMALQQKHLLDSFSERLAELTRVNETKLEMMRGTVEEKLRHLQEDNNRKLEQMRATVDEKLHATLEQRLGESFKLVSDRLELVHQGLGEMKSLANGVGDLRKVLTNVKTRGTLGEIQLGNLLEQTLTVEQYDRNAATRRGSSERVEFAVRIPDKHNSNQIIHLPIDSKFPIEDYQRLLDALDADDHLAAAECSKQLDARIKQEAKSIRDKYIDPPNTTDFGIMFLPVEGLFAEVLRRPGLWEQVQREFRVVIAGPTTLTALLNSLQMGFQTLAIQQRSSEVWQVLGAVKTEFGKFGDLLDKTQKKLQEASNSIDAAAVRSRAIERRLRKVQELPAGEAPDLLLEAASE